VVRAGWRRKGTRLRRARRSSKAKEHPEDGNMSVQDQGGAGLDSGVWEYIVAA
jgi:hypothetical protein